VTSPLVIVESPAKARTIAGYLGDDYVVESSIGHIRDLPRNAADVPAAYKGESWARLGVDTDNDFKPLYVVSPDKKDQVKNLKKLLKNASELYLATDEDREGEAIAWHLLEVLSPQVPVRRMVFHEITPEAIQRSIDEPREIDRRLVDAQEARRILDRLYGYEVSPVLWKKVMPRLSAGRVQSVATRIVVDRERARMRFTAAGYWDVEGTFEASAGADFPATLVALDGRRLATGKDFDENGDLTADVARLDEQGAGALVEALGGADFATRSVEAKPYTRKPYAPFMTSTLQQEAGRKLRFSSARTMSTAQRLYENGYITYMRTDSTTLSDTALSAARSQLGEKYGAEYLPDKPRIYTRKVKNAQEAHEAIRPAGDRFRDPASLRGQINQDEFRLYELIWRRTVASQMTDARGRSVQVRLGATAADGRDAEFGAGGKTILFPGFLRAYVEGSDDPEGELEDQERILPDLEEGAGLEARTLEPKGHETQPPARFTEASLVRRLEELGVGRPSTYASIISTIQDRGYVWKKGSALVPSFTAFAVITVLEQHFPDLVDYAFTARMEDDLDGIAAGEAQAIPWLSRFYFGEGEEGLALKELVEANLGDIDARAVNSIPLGVDADGVEIVARVGRYGPYLQRGEDTASIPDDLPPDELTVERAVELVEAPSGDRALGTDPDSGLTVLVRNGRFGAYIQLGDADEVDEKPRTGSLFTDMDPATVDLDTALKLLSLPRSVGTDPADGEEILVQNGRYGPYLKKGKETRSIEREDQLFTITLDECLALLKEPKRRGRQAKPPLKELGEDPVSGGDIVLKDGRYGPYVTDGEVNASLRKGDDVATIEHERAVELLAERRAKAPPKKKAAKKKTTTKKKPAAKKKATTKKKPAAKKKATTKATGTTAKKKPAGKPGSGPSGDD
jgi:DNA topoisomerase-1